MKPLAHFFDRDRRPPRLTLAYYTLTGIVFLLAAIYRFRWPAEPFFDADGWGYLWGGLRKLTGGNYEHKWGREYLYPGMIEMALFVTGGFRAITRIQHVLGLVGGGLLLGCCHLLGGIARDHSRHPERPGVWSPCWIGLALTALYLFNFDTLFYEHSIRPEAVFPCFALASVFLNLLVIDGMRDGHPRPRPWVLNAAGVNLVLCMVLMLLRPSFRLSALAANVPFVLLLRRRDEPIARRLTVLGLSLLAAVGIWLPEHLYSANDRRSTLFLSERLFSAHCDLISRQLDADLAAHRAGPYDEAWLRRIGTGISARLDDSRRPENHPWPFVGFNVDYVIVNGNPFAPFFPAGKAGDKAVNAFCRRYYLRSAFHQPVAMTRKILLQIWSFYRTGMAWDQPDRAWAGRGTVRLAPFYASTVDQIQSNLKFTTLVAASVPASDYLQSCQALTHSRVSSINVRFITGLDALCWTAHVILALLALGLCAIMPWMRDKGGPLRALAATQWLVFAYPFGICLATAIVFIVENRYVETLDALVLVSAYASGVFVWRAWCERRALIP